MRNLPVIALTILVVSVSGCGDKAKCQRAIDDLRLSRQQLHNGVFTPDAAGGADVPDLNRLTETARKLEEARSDSATYCRQ